MADELSRSDTVENLYAGFVALLKERIDETPATAGYLENDAAPESRPAFRSVRLATVTGNEANPLTSHPQKGVKAPICNHFGKFRIGSQLGNPCQVVEEVDLGVRADQPDPLMALEETVRWLWTRAQ